MLNSYPIIKQFEQVDSSFFANPAFLVCHIVPLSWNRDGGTAASSWLSNISEFTSCILPTASSHQNNTSESIFMSRCLGNKPFFISVKIHTFTNGSGFQKLPDLECSTSHWSMNTLFLAFADSIQLIRLSSTSGLATRPILIRFAGVEDKSNGFSHCRLINYSIFVTSNSSFSIQLGRCSSWTWHFVISSQRPENAAEDAPHRCLVINHLVKEPFFW